MEGFRTIEDMGLLEKTKAELNNYDYVRFVFSDISGVSRGLIVPLRHAINFLDSGLAGYAGKTLSDLMRGIWCFFKHMDMSS